MTLRRIAPTGTRYGTTVHAIEPIKRTILIVDDEQVIPVVLKRIAERMGYKVEVYNKPGEALERYKRGGVDLVVTDREMPGMDGYELTGEILKHNPKARVVMITGMANRQELDSAIDVGCVAGIAKPFDMKTIEGMLRTILQTECTVEPPMGMRVSVLVATDENTGNVAITALNMAGYKATAAKSAREVGDVIQEREVEVVVIDFAMTNFDMALKEIRAKKPDAKIIVIADREQIADVEKLEGIVSVILKPVDNRSWEVAVKDAITPTKTKATVLIVDDDEDTRTMMESFIGSKEYPPKTARNGLEALEMYRQGGIELVLTDLEMPDMDGLGLLIEIKKVNPDAKVIVVTGKDLNDIEYAAIMAAGALKIVKKPTELMNELVGLLEMHATI